VKTRLNSLRIILLGAMSALSAGCGKTNNNDSANGGVLVSNVPLQVSAGACVPVEGPFAFPDGASTTFTVTDVDNTDYMNVGVIASAYGCNFGAGYGVVLNTNSTRSGEDNLPRGDYDFVVECTNSLYPCQFALNWEVVY
jgi:hypothetical protein